MVLLHGFAVWILRDLWRMFIRTTRTRNSTTGETYITLRLVESRRVGGKVRQVTRLNLGRQFTFPGLLACNTHPFRRPERSKAIFAMPLARQSSWCWLASAWVLK
ncbi:MAG: hypothetical protein PHV02_01615 [Rhodocyclaceae bacterium]|nr:hypothetical protein [Rhodocyclaceae bacterium]